MQARFIIPLAVFVALVAIFAVGLKRDPREVPSPLIDKPIPTYTLPNLQVPETGFDQGLLTAQPVALLNVWASWCTACRQEHPFMMELARSGALTIYGLNYKDERDDALAWLARHGNPYTASGFDHSGRVAIDWGVYGVPESFLVDFNGKIRYKVIGPLDRQTWELKLKPLIAQIRAEAQAAGRTAPVGVSDAAPGVSAPQGAAQ